MSFAVGQKIVCIAGVGEWFHPTGIEKIMILPRKGGIYHVRAFDGRAVADDYYIWLVEITNNLPGHGEPSFVTSFFRPVIERKTDIAIFTAMLTPTKVPA